MKCGEYQFPCDITVHPATLRNYAMAPFSEDKIIISIFER